VRSDPASSDPARLIALSLALASIGFSALETDNGVLQDRDCESPVRDVEDRSVRLRPDGFVYVRAP
jgi:hypothetical protein